jgi:hypothetical protein
VLVFNVIVNTLLIVVVVTMIMVTMIVVTVVVVKMLILLVDKSLAGALVDVVVLVVNFLSSNKSCYTNDTAERT